MGPQFQGNVNSFAERWAQRLFVTALFLLPTLVIPLSWFPFLLLKTTVFSLLVSVALLLFVVYAYKQGGFVVPKNHLVWAILALPVVYGISSIFSQNPTLSYMGNGVEANTVFFAALCALAAVAGALVLTSKRSVMSAMLALFCALSVVGVFQILQLFFGPQVFGMSAFSTLSSNLAGKWNDFGLLMGLLAVFSMSAIDLIRPRAHALIVCVVALIASLVLLALVNLDSLWQVLGGLAVLVGAMTLFGRETYPDPMLPQTRKAPYASMVVLICSVVFIVWGSQLNTAIVRFVPISELEVRPALTSTYDILKNTYAQSVRTALLGSGPGTFIEQWRVYKPAQVNSTQFWNLDFGGGAGVIPTAFITTGLFGGLVWVVILALLLVVLVRAARIPHPDIAIRSTLLLSGLGAFFLLAASALYLAGEVPLLVAFSLLALALAAERLSSPHESIFRLRGTPLPSRVIGYGVVAIVLVSSITLSALLSQRLTAGFWIGRALTTPTTNTAQAEVYAKNALGVYTSDEVFRLLSNIKLAQAQVISNEDPKVSQDQAQRFQNVFGEAVQYGQQAVTADPRNYQNYILLAQLFEALIPLKVEGAYDKAKQYYNEAIAHNQLNPGLFLAAARMEAEVGNTENFKQAIQSAFTLKPNYTEVALLVAQVEIARNNIDGAIVAAEVAAQTAPQNPGIFFQLALLKYAKGDAPGARDGFEHALALQPDYANAKYFLGLTYQKLQRTQEAIDLFRDLRKTNPDNAEVQLILGNLQQGKDPFASSTPPITPNPETRDIPPINE